MLTGIASVLIAQSYDLVSLVAIAIGRAASVGFLRLATLALAQGFDLATFSVMVARHGTAAEANQMVSSLFQTYGMPAVILAKLGRVSESGQLGWAPKERPRGWLELNC